jgi:hypothetical protein
MRKGVRGEERCTYREHIRQSAAPAGEVPIAREGVALVSDGSFLPDSKESYLSVKRERTTFGIEDDRRSCLRSIRWGHSHAWTGCGGTPLRRQQDRASPGQRAGRR